MIIKNHHNFDVLRFVAAPFHIAQIAEKQKHIEKFKQNFLRLMPLVIDDFIQAKEAYIFLGSTNLAIANMQEEFKFYLKNVGLKNIVIT